MTVGNGGLSGLLLLKVVLSLAAGILGGAHRRQTRTDTIPGYHTPVKYPAETEMPNFVGEWCEWSKPPGSEPGFRRFESYFPCHIIRA